MNILNHCVTGVLVAFCASQAQAATVYTYDELNRLTRVVYDDGLTISYRYDAAGNLLEWVKEAAAQPVVGGKLNDTGITANQCYAAGSDILVSCASPAAKALNALQDGMVGRDVSDPGGADGKLGFSFAEIPGHQRTECVKDKLTGLVWEGKTADGGPRDRIWFYSNVDNGVADDASGYIRYVNGLALCGYSDWRLPNVGELQSIIDYGRTDVAIDTDWFPNPMQQSYWTSVKFATFDAKSAWAVQFSTGSIDYFLRTQRLPVRLVRGAEHQQ